MRFHKTIEIIGSKMEDLKEIGMTPIDWAGSVPTFEFGDIFNIGKKTGSELLDYAKDRYYVASTPVNHASTCLHDP